jgi:hypothetical protein
MAGPPPVRVCRTSAGLLRRRLFRGGRRRPNSGAWSPAIRKHDTTANYCESFSKSTTVAPNEGASMRVPRRNVGVRARKAREVPKGGQHDFGARNLARTAAMRASKSVVLGSRRRREDVSVF